MEGAGPRRVDPFQRDDGFSKKLENLKAAVAVFMAWYNFCRVHQTLRVTPAMAAGVTKRLWEMTDLVEMVEAWEESGKLAA